MRGGDYVADFRYDEGIRIRDDNICPCLSTPTGGGISQMLLVIEVIDEDQKPNENGLLCSTSGGGASRLLSLTQRQGEDE